MPEVKGDGASRRHPTTSELVSDDPSSTGDAVGLGPLDLVDNEEAARTADLRMHRGRGYRLRVESGGFEPGEPVRFHLEAEVGPT